MGGLRARPRLLAAGAGVLLLAGCTANQLLAYLTDSLFGAPPFTTLVERLEPAGSANSSFGWAVDVDGDFVIVGAPYATGGGAAWIFRRQADGSFDAGTKLTASDATADDRFGQAVGISGDWAVVGADRNDAATADDDGSIYIFERTGGNSWTEDSSFNIDDFGQGAVTNDRLGYEVAIHGDWIAATSFQDDLGGAANDNYGAVYLFRWAGGSWGYDSRLDPGATPDKSSANFGQSVELRANEILVGAHGEAGATPDEGAAYIYLRVLDSWELSDHIVSPTPQNNGWFGLSSSIGGDYVLVGEPLVTQDGADQAGAVYAFERGAGDNWDADPPEQILADTADTGDWFGVSVAIEGDHALIGAVFKNDNGDDAGAVYLYERTGPLTWERVEELIPDGLVAGDYLGRSVAMDDDGLAVVGATDISVGAEPGGDGAVYVYE